MPHLSIAEWLWVPSAGAQVGIVLLMARNRARHEFPLFFQYVILQIAAAIVITPLYLMSQRSIQGYALYFYGYWAFTAVSAFVGFAVIHEIFKSAFKPYAALRDLAAILFRWATLVLLLVATVLAFTSGSSKQDALIVAILSVERSVLVMQAGMLLFLMMFASRLGLTWKNYAFGIALGFGFYAGCQLAVNALFSQLGPSFGPSYSALGSWFYMLQSCVWLGYLASPEPARVAVENAFSPKPILDRWNSVLAGESAIPQSAFLLNLEKIVDHVMEERK
jgi:hypothetical protein